MCVCQQSSFTLPLTYSSQSQGQGQPQVLFIRAAPDIFAYVTQNGRMASHFILEHLLTKLYHFMLSHKPTLMDNDYNTKQINKKTKQY